MSTAAPSVTPMVFRDTKSAWYQRSVGVVVLGLAAVAAALGVWIAAVIVGAVGAHELVRGQGRVTFDGQYLVLRALRLDRWVPLADVALVDANFTGYVNRCPHLVLGSGDRVPLTPFHCSTLLRTRSRASERLAEHLGLPTTEPAGSAVRIGWFACAATIVVGVIIGLPLVLGGVDVLVSGGGVLGGTVALAVGLAICAAAVKAIALQRIRKRAAT